MVGKKNLLLKSIRELLALNVSDKEIIMNLKEVGIDRAQGQKLIKEAKDPKAGTGKEAAVENFFQKFEEKAKIPARRRPSREDKARLIEKERLEATEELAEEAVVPEDKKASPEDIAEDIGVQIKPKKMVQEKADLSGLMSEVRKETAPNIPAEKLAVQAREEEKPKEEKPFIETPLIEIKDQTPIAEPAHSANLVEDVNVSKLWEKGIMGTVNQNLAEMKRLKTDIESIMDLKVEQATKKEVNKIKVLFDSQRALLVSKVDSEIEAKAKSFATMIELKLREMREINKKIDDQIEKLEKEKEKSKKDEESLYLRIKSIDKVKEDLVAALNSELIKSKSQNKQTVLEMNKQLKEMDARINKTLQLENQIVEGLVKSSEQKIQEMLEARSDTFTKETTQQLAEIKKLKGSFETEHNQKLTLLEEKMKASVIALDSQVKKRLAKLDELEKAITVDFQPAKFNALMNELNSFKSQFVDAVQQNAKHFNEALKSLNNQSKMMEKQFNLRAEKIDKKIAELDTFEKNFAKEIGVSLEKLTKAGKK